MMLVSALVVTALLVSDVAGMDNSTEVEETLRAIADIKQGRCETGWFEYSNTRSCYRCFTAGKSWKDAEALCNREKHYGQLASVSSCEHNDFITKVVRKAVRGSRSVWIGFKDYCKTGSFLWSDESPIRYMNWAEGRPLDPKRKQYCTYTNTGNNAWYDYNCNSGLYYVCAYKLH